ncbi:hypothetical protein ONE63_002986 [Megalurothrips usitatus]|uniref:Rho guanine nucleotide exchange factor 12-like n=1 Tax=Megalurothrips usitatus TaxID=439358 RepID=A0AAV7X5X8_9NEOP|nr:hypothetical protein ONE63_002986 [Megalurothrips usitatus]
MAEAGVLPSNQLNSLFQNLDQMLEIHSELNNSFKCKRKENPVVGDVGDLLLSMFDGPAGNRFQAAACKFCSQQQVTLENLKDRRKKDAKLHNFLTEAEGNPMCRRLQLKDILPSGMLRLTKYPLLFENLLKYTDNPEDSVSPEYSKIQRALERSKEILNHVNVAVSEAEDEQKLLGIQKRIDRSAFDKADVHGSQEFKNLDITKHKLIHEGPLNWRIGSRQKFVDLHVLLMEEIIILLQRQDEKFILKYYNVNSGGTSSNERAPTLSPIIKVSTVLVRPNAVDKKALYLVNTSHNGAQIYDLVASSSSERKVWFRRISEAAEKYKKTDHRSRKSEASNNQQEDSTENDKSKKEDGGTQGCPDEDTSMSDKLASDTSSTSTPVASNHMQAPQSSSTPITPAGDTMISPPLQRRNEPLRLTTEENALIEPSEVTVSQRSVLTAEPVLTPIERLRRKDEAVRQALLEKQQLVADILHVPREDFNTIAEIAAQPSHDKEAAEVVLAAINQVNLLSSVLNESLRVSEEDTVVASVGTSPRLDRRSTCMPAVPVDRLIDVSSSISAQLTQLLKMMKERDEERERLRRELQRCREQLHVMHESQRREKQDSQSETATDLDVSGKEGDALNRVSGGWNNIDSEGLEEVLPRLSLADEGESETVPDGATSVVRKDSEASESTTDCGSVEVTSEVKEADPH